MKYNYLPDSYDYNLISLKNISYDSFLNLQLKYRESLENILNNYIDFSKIDEIIKSLNFSIPTLDDSDYNFYHKFSKLGSKYIFLRNNIHIERLELNDIQKISNAIVKNENLPEDFIRKTLETVLFESGTETFFGSPVNIYKVNSKSLIFEFAYNDLICDVEQGKLIRNFYNKIFEIIKNSLEANIKVPINFIVFDGFDIEAKNILNNIKDKINNEII